MTKRLVVVLGLLVLAGVLVAASAQAGHETQKVTNVNSPAGPQARMRTRSSSRWWTSSTRRTRASTSRGPSSTATTDSDDRAVRRSQPARRLLRRLERHRLVGEAGRHPAAEQLRGEDPLQHEGVLSEAARRLQERQDDLRLPEGLVAAREETNNAARAGRHEGAEDVGAAPVRREDDGRRASPSSRSASRPTGRGWAPSCTRTTARSRSTSRRRPTPGGELLRRPAQERPRLHAAGGQLVRRGARQGPRRDHLRGQLAAPVHEVDLPEHALRHLPDGQGQDAAATSPSPSRTRWRRTRRTRTPPGRCSAGWPASRARRSGCRRASRSRRATT